MAAVVDVAEGRLQISDEAVREVFALRSRDREYTSLKASDMLTKLERETFTQFANGSSYTELAEAGGTAPQRAEQAQPHTGQAGSHVEAGPLDLGCAERLRGRRGSGFGELASTGEHEAVTMGCTGLRPRLRRYLGAGGYSS